MADESGVSTANLELYLEYENNLNDDSGNARHQATSIGALSYDSDGAPSIAGKFVWQNGTYIDTGVEALGSCDLFCTNGQSFSFATFLRFKGVSANGAGTIVAKQLGTSEDPATQRTFFLHITQNTAARVLLRLRGQDNYYSPTNLHDGEWHHLAFTWDGTTPKFYIDTVLQSTPLVGSATEFPVNIFIGGSDLDDAPTLSSNLTGQLDETRFYSRDLTSAEITRLYQYGLGLTTGGAPGPFDALELWLRYESDSQDSSPHARHQTVTNGPLTFATGKEGTVAAKYEAGSTQYIDTGVSAFGGADLLCEVGSAWSYLTWVRKDALESGIGTLVSMRTVAGLHFNVRPNASGGGELEVHLKGNLNAYALPTIDDNSWHHVAITWDGTTAVVYYDGSPLAAPSVGAASAAAPEDILIGARDAIGGGIPANYTLLLDAHVDDTRFYSRALSAGEISALVSETALTPFTAALTFDEIDGAVATIRAVFGSPVAAFVSGDLTVSNGTVSNVTMVSTSVYTFDVTASADGVVTVVIAAGAVDAASSSAVNSASNTLAYGVGAVAAEDGDGLLRFDRTATRSFTSNAIIGPVPISPQSNSRSIVRKIHAVFGSGTTATGTVGFAGGVDGEDAVERAENDGEQRSITIATLEANHGNDYPMVGGHALAIPIDVTAGHCVLEQIDIELEPAGRNIAPRFVP